MSASRHPPGSYGGSIFGQPSPRPSPILTKVFILRLHTQRTARGRFPSSEGRGGLCFPGRTRTKNGGRPLGATHGPSGWGSDILMNAKGVAPPRSARASVSQRPDGKGTSSRETRDRLMFSLMEKGGGGVAPPRSAHASVSQRPDGKGTSPAGPNARA